MRDAAAVLASAAVLGGALLALPRPSAATYENARGVGRSCATCHASTHPGTGDLNETGRYFLVERKLPESELPGLESAAPPGAAGGPPRTAASDAPASGERAPAMTGGAELYERTCAVCHGPEGEGTGAAKPLTGPLDHGEQATDVATVVRGGVTGTSMFAFEGLLTTAEIEAVSAYVLTLRERRPRTLSQAPGRATEQRGVR